MIWLEGNEVIWFRFRFVINVFIFCCRIWLEGNEVISFVMNLFRFGCSGIVRFGFIVGKFVFGF